MRACVNTPVVKPDAGVQFIVGADDSPQQVPRAEMDAGTPRDVTFAPSVAPVVAMDVAVGEVTVGTAGGVVARNLTINADPVCDVASVDA